MDSGEFLSTFPLRGTSQIYSRRYRPWRYFYPRSPCGERPLSALPMLERSPFLSTFPLRGTSMVYLLLICQLGYFYPRSPCGERLGGLVVLLLELGISIHVPLAGNVFAAWIMSLFSLTFLSTFPLRGTSHFLERGRGMKFNFYPRSPCGERPASSLTVLTPSEISIHVPLAGNVRKLVNGLHRSTIISIHVPLAGNVWSLRRQNNGYVYISIHVPLAGNVLAWLYARYHAKHFYPRSPCGERHELYEGMCLDCLISIHVPLAGNVSTDWLSRVRFPLFLSTFPLRGTSYISVFAILSAQTFLSTFPLRGTSFTGGIWPQLAEHFYPRSPCGERPWSLFRPVPKTGISIHVPLAGNVAKSNLFSSLLFIFLSTFPLRGTSCCLRRRRVRRGISIHVPLAGNVL